MNRVKIKVQPRSMAATLLIVVILGTLIWRQQDALWAFVSFARDRQSVLAFLQPMGLAGPLLLSALLALQVLIPSLPAEPLMVAGASAYGFFGGFLLSWLTAVTASQAVFYLARHAGRPLVERFVPVRLLDKWTRTAGEKGALFFFLSFVIPPIPSDIMTYVAGLSAISGRKFLLANLLGRVPMVALFSLVGATGFTITPALFLGLTALGALMLLAWYYFIIREDKQASLPALGRSEIRGETTGPHSSPLWSGPVPSPFPITNPDTIFSTCQNVDQLNSKRLQSSLQKGSELK